MKIRLFMMLRVRIRTIATDGDSDIGTYRERCMGGMHGAGCQNRREKAVVNVVHLMSPTKWVVEVFAQSMCTQARSRKSMSSLASDVLSSIHDEDFAPPQF